MKLVGYIISLSVYLFLFLHFLSSRIKLCPFVLMGLSPAFVKPALVFSVFIKTISVSTELIRCLIHTETDLETMSYFCLLEMCCNWYFAGARCLCLRLLTDHKGRNLGLIAFLTLDMSKYCLWFIFFPPVC